MKSMSKLLLVIAAGLISTNAFGADEGMVVSTRPEVANKAGYIADLDKIYEEAKQKYHEVNGDSAEAVNTRRKLREQIERIDQIRQAAGK